MTEGYYVDSQGERWWGSDETARAVGFRHRLLAADQDGWQRDPVIRTFAARLLWIIWADYADEGLSAALPLEALAITLEAAADVVAIPWWRWRRRRRALRRLAVYLAGLDEFR